MRRISINSQMAQIDVSTINAKISVRSPKMSFRVDRTMPKQVLPQKNILHTANFKTADPQRSAVPVDISLQNGENKEKPTGGSAEEMLALKNAAAQASSAKAAPNRGLPEPATFESAETTEIETAPPPKLEWSGEWMPEFTVEPYSIEVSLAQKPSVKITVHEEAERRLRAMGKNFDHIS